MKNVMVVSKKGNAVAYGKDVEFKVTNTGVFLPSLLAIKEVLKTIPEQPCETVNIHIMDIVQGLASGSAVEYVKSGKTLSGTVLTSEEVSAFKEIYELYAKRILNVRFSLVKYIKKDDTENQNLKKEAYAILNKMEVSSGGSVSNTVIIDPDKELRDKLIELMAKALEEGDFDKYDKLNERKEALTKPVAESGSSIEKPVFEASENEAISFDEKDEDEKGEAETGRGQISDIAGLEPAFN